MAHMYPEQIPERIRLNHGHEAEVELYQVLQDELPPQYRVFCWIQLMRSNTGIRQTELDFVVLDPERGFVALEAGWMVTELGRQPWVVYGVLRTNHAVTPMPGLIVPLVVFSVVYAGLGVVVAVILRSHWLSTVTAPPDEGAS